MRRYCNWLNDATRQWIALVVKGPLLPPLKFKPKGKPMIYRVRIKHADGTISVLDKTHSQMCEHLRGISRIEFRAFLAGCDIHSPNGNNTKFMRFV